MTTTAKHQGGCHCGAIRYSATFDATTGFTCNCSICSRRGTIVHAVPAADFTLEKGEQLMRDYQFGKQKTHHLFCTECGCAPFSWGTGKQGEKLYAVNVRCVDGFDEKQVKTEMFDGQSLPLH